MKKHGIRKVRPWLRFLRAQGEIAVNKCVHEYIDSVIRIYFQEYYYTHALMYLYTLPILCIDNGYYFKTFFFFFYYHFFLFLRRTKVLLFLNLEYPKEFSYIFQYNLIYYTYVSYYYYYSLYHIFMAWRMNLKTEYILNKITINIYERK